VYTGDADKQHKMKFAKGTTTLAFRYKGGVIVAVDSRSTQGPYIGELVVLDGLFCRKPCLRLSTLVALGCF
jgi:hypothetical protein